MKKQKKTVSDFSSTNIKKIDWIFCQNDFGKWQKWWKMMKKVK
jgi:hypothetical protein